MQSSSFMNVRVLLVDDDTSLGETLAVGLRKRGLIADARTSGADALATLEAQDVDVVVTDLNMRGLGGIELCRRIVASRPALLYVDNSTEPGKSCSRCQQFLPAAPGACGACKVVKGPINPDGYCKSFVAKPA
jgi:CheY-like chemotaxis protein